jgi:hypothetical protein
VVALSLGSAPGRAAAQGGDSTALHRPLSELARLRADLDRLNAEVAELKRADPSVRNDYRLRDRMADAEAMAQKLTQAEARLRALGWKGAAGAGVSTPVAPPQALPQDGNVELEAKAGLFADQASKLDGEAGVLAKAADELRSRKTLRRRAGAWDRDPFSGLETSKRSLAVSVQKGGQTQTQTGSGDTQITSSGAPPVTMLPGPGGASDSGRAAVAAETSSASKTSPQTAGLDRQSFEQHLYLDPATAAELRHVLGAAGATSDPDALDRAAATLRSRARALKAQAQSLLVKSRAP